MKDILRPTCLLILTFLLLKCQNNSTEENSHATSVLPSQLDSLVSTHYQNQRFSGAVLVADQGKIILNKEYGFKDLEETQLITSESLFEIASISKQFTALLIMQLEEEGLLEYDDQVKSIFPNFPYSDITIRHLLTHTSGLSERLFFMWAGQNMVPGKIYHNEFVLSYLESQKPDLSFEPGENWEYSNVGYFLLALIIQKTTGKHYIEVLKERILNPLGMENTGIFSQEIKGSDLDQYTFGKVFNSKDSVFNSSFGLAWSDSMYGGVGILSNTIDLLKWDRALYKDTLLDQDNLKDAFEAYLLSNGKSSEYGFGWYVKDNFQIKEVNTGKRLEHNGLWPGYESSIVRYIDRDKTIIILSNQSPSSKDILIEEISQLLF